MPYQETTSTEQFQEAQQWLFQQPYREEEPPDSAHNQGLDFLMRNSILMKEMPNANGQAAQYLKQLAEAMASAQRDGITAAAQRMKDIIAAIEADTVKTYLNTSRMMWAHFRQLPDETLLVVSDHGDWFQQQDPEVVEHFHQLVKEEKELLESLRQEEARQPTETEQAATG